MNQFDVYLTQSVNGIPFGADRVGVRSALGETFKEFQKSKFSKNTTDDFGSCHIFYSADNKMDAIEIFPDAGVTININGKKISLEYTSLIEWVKTADPESEEDDEGIVSKKLSIGIYAPNQELESILFGKGGYYI